MASKKEEIAKEVARAVGAGKPVAMETVDFSDPNRPKTCLEVDFPILPVNQMAAIEGKGSGALKPIYQVSKWWARRRSIVFRAMLISAATRSHGDSSQTAKKVWEAYYNNHQKKGAFKQLKVADIFMGGGTTLVEGSRLGMQMFGNDLNPVAWFVVKQELVTVDIDEVRGLAADVENEVKSQILPFYYCDGPNGEKGKWTHIPTGRVEGSDFDPLSLTPEQRKEYAYKGPEIIYTFWAKHGPCRVTGCGHTTPIFTSPLVAAKSVTVKCWPCACKVCGAKFDVEERAPRLAPGVALCVSPTEKPFRTLDPKGGVHCPQCGEAHDMSLGKATKKKIELSLLVHPDWLAGAQKQVAGEMQYGGSAQDSSEATFHWNDVRAESLRLLEVRGELPETVKCPETGVEFGTGKAGGTVPRKSAFACGGCGTTQDILEAVRLTGKTGPLAAYAVQASWNGSSSAEQSDARYFLPASGGITKQINASLLEWDRRKDADLAGYWPKSEVPYGFMTGIANGDIRTGHGFTHWSTMFHPRQLLVLSMVLKSIMTAGNYTDRVREYVLSAFQQYLRNQNLFCFWNVQRALEPMFSNNNFHPKSNMVENSCFSGLGRGDFKACVEKAIQAQEWLARPWDIASVDASGHSEKVHCDDPVDTVSPVVECCSATDLPQRTSSAFDLVITDPPFGGLLHYSELSDFFYVWLRLVLQKKYPVEFGAEYTPKSLEAVANRAREPENPDAFYQRLLTQSWREAHRMLKPGGILAFTFHHSEDEPWIAVLESLFDAGFYLEATYPIRSDETKGEGEFGSKKIEYDIIHVCRKRTEESLPVSWGRMRREVLTDVAQLQAMLENHAKEGLPAADLQVIKRGKALEYFSRHYGKVFKSDGAAISVKEALVGINQILDEDAAGVKDAPPASAEPITRQFLRIFEGKNAVARDQMQKFLRGSGMAPDDFEQRGWCGERNKIFVHVEPVAFAQDWQGRHRRKLSTDLDQAILLIGACFDGSGVNAADTLKNENFKPHPALKDLLGWYMKRGADQPIRNAATRALTIYNSWAATHRAEIKQMSFFFDEDEAA